MARASFKKGRDRGSKEKKIGEDEDRKRGGNVSKSYTRDQVKWKCRARVVDHKLFGKKTKEKKKTFDYTRIGEREPNRTLMRSYREPIWLVSEMYSLCTRTTNLYFYTNL